MLNAKSFANAMTTVWAVGYLMCALLAFFLPDIFFRIAGSWFHAINIQTIRATDNMSLPAFIGGFVSFGIYIWLISFATISLYNRFSKLSKV